MKAVTGAASMAVRRESSIARRILAMEILLRFVSFIIYTGLSLRFRLVFSTGHIHFRMLFSAQSTLAVRTQGTLLS